MSRKLRRHLTPLNVVLGALAAGGVIAAMIVIGPESSATAARERTVTVTKGVVQSTVSGSGNLSPANTMDLSFGATGKVTKVYVKAGQHVTSGQLLARIDSSTAEVDLAEAQATLSSAQDALDAIESETTTTNTTAPSTSTPSTSTTTRTPTTPSGSGSTMSEASAVAAVKSAQLAVDNAQDALTETALRAPTAATVAAVNGAVGDQVSAGSGSASSASGSGSGSASGSGGAGAGSATATGASSSSTSGFITLTQLSRMHLEVSLSESDINSVKVGQQATVTINAASGEQVAGKVIDIGVLSSSSSSAGTSTAVSYPVTIALTQTTKGLRAGMSATAEIVTGQASGVIVPTQALQGSNVTVVKDGKRTTQRVTTGVAGDSTTQIVSGLSAGQQVVVTSSSAAAGANASGSGTSGTGGLTGRTGRTGLGTGFGGAGGFAGGAGPPAGFAGGGGR